jgi:hypothetical protein
MRIGKRRIKLRLTKGDAMRSKGGSNIENFDDEMSYRYLIC